MIYGGWWVLAWAAAFGMFTALWHYLLTPKGLRDMPTPLAPPPRPEGAPRPPRPEHDGSRPAHLRQVWKEFACAALRGGQNAVDAGETANTLTTAYKDLA